MTDDNGHMPLTKVEFDLDADLTPNITDTHNAAVVLALAADVNSQASFVADMITDAIVKTGRPGQIVLEVIKLLSAYARNDAGVDVYHHPDTIGAFQKLAAMTAPTEQEGQ